MADDLETYLNSLADKIGDRVSQSILEQAARLSLAQRQALESQEHSEPTGDLLESCTVVAGENDGEVTVQAGGELTTKPIRDGSGIPYDYAEAFEFGTSKQPARPFFYNTYDALRDDMVEAIQQDIGEELE